MPIPPETAVVLAGIPAQNRGLYRRIRFVVHDPAVLVELPGQGGPRPRHLILRDIEMGRARRHARVDHVHCPADFEPSGGLSGDRETATAQATAELIRRHGVRSVVADRSLPLIYWHFMRQAGLDVLCDVELGVLERRSKDDQEVAWLREAQAVTEEVMRLACECVAGAAAAGDGSLSDDQGPLTSERLRRQIDVWMLERGYANPDSIVAGGPQGADCHDHGAGPLRTGEPVIIDIFPQNRRTLYNGDCTRTVVHGEVSERLAHMHRAVADAKRAAIAATRAGVTGEAVHEATRQRILAAGYSMGLPPDGADDDYCAMTHGTGHGIGLDVHEPPLLDDGGPELVAGDALTIEPGLYSKAVGGIRVEDLVIVRDDGCDNLNTLPEGLAWR